MLDEICVPTVCVHLKLNCRRVQRRTAFENHRKSLIQNCVYILSGQKLLKNAKNGPIWRVFEKPEACGQTVLPDRSVLIGQILMENAKIQMRHFE